MFALLIQNANLKYVSQRIIYGEHVQNNLLVFLLIVYRCVEFRFISNRYIPGNFIKFSSIVNRVVSSLLYRTVCDLETG